jgi:WD repeat-containing protein 48
VIDADKENGKDSSTSFGKKFRMGMSFGSKKLGRSASTNTDKPIVTDDKDKAADEGSESSESGEKVPEKEKEVEDNLYGIVQKIRNEYERLLTENPTQEVESGITPSLPNETPVLKVPGGTTVIIQEETSGGVKDLYRGSVETVGEDADVIGERAPMWLGDLLLRVRLLPLPPPVPFFIRIPNIPSHPYFLFPK